MADRATSRTRRQRAKRVTQACDYCRQKRLKCTANQYPCLNCQLYDAECTTRGQARRVGTTQTPSDSGAQDVVRVAENQPQVGMAQWTQEQDLDHAANQDFNNLVQQLGIGVASDFIDLDDAMLADFSHADTLLSPGHGPWTGYTLPTRPHATADPMPGPAGLSPSGIVSSIDSLVKQDANTTELDRSIPPGVFIRKNEGVANYLGITSVGATMALCLRDAHESQRIPVDGNSMGFLVEAGPHVDEVGLSSRLDLSAQSLPRSEAAMQSIDAYFKTLDGFYPIVDEEPFRAKAHMLYTSDRSHVSVVDYSMFCLVVSLGAMGISQTSGRSDANEQLSADAYERAWSIMNDSIATPCEASLQVLLLHIVRHSYFGKSGIAWVFCGLAIRIAEAIGLHRKIPKEMDVPKSQVWLRSRLWWILLHLDASLSISQGRPPGLIHTTYDLDTRLPDASMDEDKLVPSLAQFLTWRFRLNRIQTRFCSAMHSSDTAASRLEAITRADEEMSEWTGDLPTICRPDHHISVSPDRYLQVVLLHLDYFNLLRTIYWAAITLGSTGSNASPRIRASEILCLEAARSFIKTLNNSMNELGARRILIFSFLTNNYMAAIAVLYRSISKNPLSFSARADLEHLRAGKIHLDLDTPSNGTVPALKALFENMLSNAQDFVWKPDDSQASSSSKGDK
ncbi:hypothetical protein CEP54_016317 [Fusarium duplospermum]|uniref:Zn(2)-C6 fungal-type domain-containing protein n=1 Tax=Fusarium duplospermum TaxID=1325734 RepID=A0A428NFA5_9HYPO|nr:hypothetical protein CEP54_016317 [Fusarium duplospermum]